jgi:NAD(P)-dependent dehydrogenase (short-subunit alcohol dehydrogenase family)
MKIDLGGKTAIVTGASRGIGKAIAEIFLQNSATVIIADILEEVSKRTAEELSAKGICRFIKTNVASGEDVKTMIETVVAEFGKVDIFVNNAGTNVSADPKDRTTIDKFTRENWDKLLDINLTGVFNCSQEVSRVMIRQRSGKIINIGSVLGSIPARNQIAFVAAKAGVHNMTKAMALELAPFGINVNGVAPGSIAMDINLFDKQNDPKQAELREQMLSHVPAGRFGNVDDVANAVLFLSGNESNYITGHILTVDGGWTCGYARNF